MKFKMTMVAVVVALAATNLHAQETYNVEAIGSTNTLSSDDQSKQSGTLLGAAYYLKPIKLNSTQPFAELDFLQKASGIALLYSNTSAEDATFTNTTVTPISITGKFYADNFLFGFTTSNWNADFKFKANTARYYGFKNNTTGINFGYFITPETAVSFKNNKVTYSFTPSTGLAAIGDLGITTNSISSQTVTSLGGTQSMRIDLTYNMITREEATIASKKNTEYGGNLRFYPESKYYVGGGYLINTGDRDYSKGKTLSAEAGYAFTPRFGVLLSTAKFTGDVSTEQSSSTSTTLSLGYRF